MNLRSLEDKDWIASQRYVPSDLAQATTRLIYTKIDISGNCCVSAPRRSGKTRAIIEHAIKSSSEGKRCTIITVNSGMSRCIEPYIRDTGVRVFNADPRFITGRQIDVIYFDEFAFVNASVQEALMDVAVPTGAELKIASSPGNRVFARPALTRWGEWNYAQIGGMNG